MLEACELFVRVCHGDLESAGLVQVVDFLQTGEYVRKDGTVLDVFDSKEMEAPRNRANKCKSVDKENIEA